MACKRLLGLGLKGQLGEGLHSGHGPVGKSFRRPHAQIEKQRLDALLGLAQVIHDLMAAAQKCPLGLLPLAWHGDGLKQPPDCVAGKLQAIQPVGLGSTAHGPRNLARRGDNSHKVDGLSLPCKGKTRGTGLMGKGSDPQPT